MEKATWKDIIADVIENFGRAVKLEEIYKLLEGHKKTLNNRFWKEKVRQTLQINNIFVSVKKGNLEISLNFSFVGLKIDNF